MHFRKCVDYHEGRSAGAGGHGDSYGDGHRDGRGDSHGNDGRHDGRHEGGHEEGHEGGSAITPFTALGSSGCCLTSAPL